MTQDAETFRTRVHHVLQQVAPGSQASEWIIDLLNEGPHALVFAVRRKDGGLIDQGHREFAVKLYRPEAWHGVEVVQIQFESMADFHARLHGHRAGGWEIVEPLPLFQCKTPLALVMTRVPGKSLNAYLRNSLPLTTETLDSLASALVAALNCYWSLGARPYGDLNLDNVLCDLSAQTLSFVDPGVLQDGFLCERVGSHFYPASRDLAYLVFDTSSAVKKTSASRCSDRTRIISSKRFLGRICRRSLHASSNWPCWTKSARAFRSISRGCAYRSCLAEPGIACYDG
jgi:hypothetical protein